MKYKFYFEDGRTQNIQGDQDRIDWCINQLKPLKIERIDKRKSKL